jgi:cytochrome c oxidase subunit 2
MARGAGINPSLSWLFMRHAKHKESGMKENMKLPMNRSNYIFVALLPLALVMLLALGSPRMAHADGGPRVIEITAKRFAFSPNQITIKKGETVKLRLTSEDVTHGFFMRALKIDEDIQPGTPTEITLTPQTAGTFTTICDHFCGANHGNMNMTITVVEQ